MFKIGETVFNDSIETINIEAYQKFTYLELESAHVGSTINDLIKRWERIVSYYILDKKDEAIKEYLNSRLTLAYQQAGFYPNLIGIGCFIRGNENFEWESLYDACRGLDVDEIISAKNTIIENIQREGELHFPQYFMGSDIYESDEKSHISRLNLHLQKYIETLDDSDFDSILQEEASWETLLDTISIEKVVSERKVQFAKLCTELMSNGISNPKSLTVFEFYAALQKFEDQARRNTNHPHGVS